MASKLWVLAGGNGAGKSSFYRTFLQPAGIPLVNADLIARQVYELQAEKNSYAAAKIAEEQRQRFLLTGQSFCFETVFSHPSKIDFIAKAKALGYQVVLVFIHLSSPDLNKARISQRVEAGGHSVPDNKVEPRIRRALDNLAKAIPLCDQVRLLDNSSAINPLQLIATVRNGGAKVELHQQPLPKWAAQALRGFTEGKRPRLKKVR
ncbi:MAG: AAA family ATPase [Cellvibrionaceae bacterium]